MTHRAYCQRQARLISTLALLWRVDASEAARRYCAEGYAQRWARGHQLDP